ncbi:hypothetical protein F5Y17DRAFT_421661 [Xylariaceae sp. FL0594]|nr:hypothetical protein F5Y17DRAFT_421661 [Xylariaceae sp. FL0594]
MVARTVPCNSLRKGILSKIHQPLPLNQRESQQLLQSITTSFRRNLDREHPWQASGTSADAQVPEQASAQSTTRHPVTEQHLHTILSNPLFSRPRIVDPAVSSSPNTLQKHFDVFDSAVSKGLMTPRRATGFLATVRSEILAQSSDNVGEKTAASGAGLLVLRWLRSSGYENSFEFLEEPALVKLLVYFLYAEGLQEVAWNWLARIAAAQTAQHQPPDVKNPARAIFRLLSAIANESSGLTDNDHASLDGAYTALARANDIFPREGGAAAASALRGAWSEVSWTSTVKISEHPKPTTTLFESFIDIGRPFCLPLHSAHLLLHHPTKPTVQPAIDYLSRLQSHSPIMSSMGPRTQQHILCLVLDAANRIGYRDGMDWLLRLKSDLLDQLNLGFLNADNQIRRH